MVLTLLLASGSIARVVNIKGAFLHGEFKDGEKIYIKIPLRFKEFYDDTQFYSKRSAFMDLNKWQ